MQIINIKCSHTFVDRCFCDVSDTSGFDYVPNDELLDGLVLWDTTGAVGASNWLDVASALLCSSIVSSL